jgi:hypothetical protein
LVHLSQFGACFVPVFSLVAGFGLKEATALSQAAIAGMSLTVSCLMLSSLHIVVNSRCAAASALLPLMCVYYWVDQQQQQQQQQQRTAALCTSWWLALGSRKQLRCHKQQLQVCT